MRDGATRKILEQIRSGMYKGGRLRRGFDKTRIRIRSHLCTQKQCRRI